MFETWNFYPENLNVRDHVQVAFKTSKFKKAYNDSNNNTQNGNFNFYILHYTLLSAKITEDIEEQTVCLTTFSAAQRSKILTGLTIFSKQLSKHLSKTRIQIKETSHGNCYISN